MPGPRDYSHERQHSEQELVLSAPGKVILFGEHSVVYGRRAVAVSLDLRTKLTLTHATDSVTLDLPDVSIRESWSIDSIHNLYSKLTAVIAAKTNDSSKPSPLSLEGLKIITAFLGVTEDTKGQKTLALLSFFHLYTSLLAEVKGCVIKVSSQIPTGAGLGSSAAYASCLAGALLILSERVSADSLLVAAEDKIRKHSLELVNKWTYVSETIMHGNPSGIDNTACSFGGVISFKAGSIDPLGTCGLQIMLVNTKVPRSTKVMVQTVKQKLEKYPNVVNPLLESMNALAEQSLLVLRRLAEAEQTTTHDEASLTDELGELMDMNHSLLRALGVSHASLEKVVQESLSHGLHAKLTGAGGGGFAMVLIPRKRSSNDVTTLMKALQGQGCQVWMVDLGVQGLCLH